MRRRAFIAGVGAAALWPAAGREQERQRVKRIGILNTLPANDDHGQAPVGRGRLPCTERSNVFCCATI
jgi:hypothetical protein